MEVCSADLSRKGLGLITIDNAVKDRFMKRKIQTHESDNQLIKRRNGGISTTQSEAGVKPCLFSFSCVWKYFFSLLLLFTVVASVLLLTAGRFSGFIS